MSCSWVTCWTIAIQPSKSVSSDRTSAPLAMGWMSWALETLSFGRNTTQGMPAAAQYAASEAEVSPVEAQATALIGVPLAIIWLTAETLGPEEVRPSLIHGDNVYRFDGRANPLHLAPDSAAIRIARPHIAR